MASTWRTHTAPAIKAAVKPYRDEGWKAGPSAARFEGADDTWAHIFLVGSPNHQYVRLGFGDFQGWFSAAFELLRPDLVRLASNEVLFDHFRQCDQSEDSMRSAIVLGAALGHDDQLLPLIERAAELSDQWEAEIKAEDPEWRFRDRMKNPIMWSHRRFMRQLDKVPAILASGAEVVD